MRDLTAEIAKVKEMLVRPDCDCDGMSCFPCPVESMIALYSKGDHQGLFGISSACEPWPHTCEEYRTAKRRWLRGWLSLATGKPVKE